LRAYSLTSAADRFLGLASPRQAVLGFDRFVEVEAVVAMSISAWRGWSPRCARTEDFEDDDGIGYNRACIWARGADDEAIRITDSAGGFDFQIEIASKEIAGLPA
jgi:hypothetical protein